MAGSVGAFGAFLLDGSEYSGSYAETMSIEVSELYRTLNNDTVIVRIDKS